MNMANRIRAFFNEDAWEMHQDTHWDPETAITLDDQCVQDIVEQDPEYQWEDLKGVKDEENNKKEGEKKR
jgi:hypothetical protein